MTGQENELTIEPFAHEDLSDLPEIPWVFPEQVEWQEGEPLFFLQDGQDGARATGWAAVTAEHILLRVVVWDRCHFNTHRGADICLGDSIQVEIDPRGGADRGGDAHAPAIEREHTSICFALTEDDVERVWTCHSGNGPVEVQQTDDFHLRIRRDENDWTTTYQVAIPWAVLGTSAGLWPTIGMAVQINDSDPMRPQRQARFGDVEAPGHSGRLPRLRLGPPPQDLDIYAAEAVSEWLVEPGNACEIAVAIRLLEACRVVVTAGELAVQQVIAPSEQVTRLMARWRPRQLPETFAVFTASIEEDVPLPQAQGFPIVGMHPGDETIDTLWYAEATVKTPEAVLRTFRGQVQSLEKAGPDPLLMRHVRCLLDFAEAQWRQDPSVELARRIESLRQQVEDPPQVLEMIHQRQTSAVLAVQSTVDGSMQPYRLWMPRSLSEHHVRPLIVYLHGRCDPSLVDFLTSGTIQPPVVEMMGPDGDQPFILEPWARGEGNRGESAEADVRDALQDVLKHFAVDPERIGLCGKSTAAAAVLRLAAQQPARFAAVAVCAASLPLEMDSATAHRLRQLPVLIWHGEADERSPAEHAWRLGEALRRQGNVPVMRIVPGRDHVMPVEELAAVFDWLAQEGFA